VAGVDVATAPPDPVPGPDPGPNPGPDPDPGPNPGPPAASTCKVPKLIGLRLGRAKKKLAKAHCKLGKVKRPKHRPKVLVVVKQSPKGGAKTKKPVALKLGKPKKH
jgi:hypothetical protein